MIPGSSTATDNSFADSIRREGQSRHVNLISLHLYNNVATIFFPLLTVYILSNQQIYPLVTGLVFAWQVYLKLITIP